MDLQTVCYERQSNKCNKDQLNKYPPEDGLIKEGETCSGELTDELNLIKVVA
jgi:hypothetical protein